MTIDTMFVLATMSFALGLSLASYRWFAVRNDWPMGEVQLHDRWIAVLFGCLGMGLAILFAMARDSVYGGWGAPLLGLFLGLALTALLKVYAQAALLLAPLATLALFLYWMWS